MRMPEAEARKADSTSEVTYTNTKTFLFDRQRRLELFNVGHTCSDV